MNTFHVAQIFPALTCMIIIWGAPLSADTVDTKNGAHLVGKITRIDCSVVYLHTDYAGDISIKQSEVASFATDQPIAVRIDSGIRLDGKVTPVNGQIQVVGWHGMLTTDVRHVAATWAAGGEDPIITARRGYWTYEASVDINGESGDHNQLGTAGGLRVVHTATDSELELYAKYNRQVTDGLKSADQLAGGVDYTNHYAERDSVYGRDEAGFDHVMGIRFSNVAAAGYGYDFIKQPKHILTGRAGLAHRYDDYKDPATPTVNAVGGDFELIHDWTFGISHLVNKLSFVPIFENLNDFIVTHDSYYQIPLANPHWKLHIGVTINYSNRPGAGIKRLDTTYYTRLLLDWQ
jgi:putative salt-induced outer membrane protein YdiY